MCTTAFQWGSTLKRKPLYYIYSYRVHSSIIKMHITLRVHIITLMCQNASFRDKYSTKVSL